MFVGFFYLFVRHFVESPAAAATACIAAVLFHSFEGTEQLFALWQLGAPLDLVKYLNIDAVTRWIYHSMPVDGLQRLLLYQPQHQLGYVMGLSALLLLVQIYRAPTANAAYLAALATDVDYVVVAPLERQRHPAIEATLDAAPNLWPLAFGNGSVSIYQGARNR